MKYVAEIVSEKDKIFEMHIYDATHPRQAVRRSVRHMKNYRPVVHRFDVYVMNQIGEIWIYKVYKKKETNEYMVEEIVRTKKLPETKVNMVLSGVSLYDVLH